MLDTKQYCEDMGIQLSQWKDEVCDILNTVEVFPENDKKLMATQISTLRHLVADLSGKIDRLKSQCPVDFGAANAEMQRSISELRKKVKTMWDFDNIAGGYVGG
jgi:hypothetical protein